MIYKYRVTLRSGLVRYCYASSALAVMLALETRGLLDKVAVVGRVS